ncbi:MAG TPA: glycosyltransferase family 4 protein [Longimicrobiaceae bacterium]|nr:glycosyltransferase family 4 protein [Longimicrobiaceae bacterium]
MKLRVLHCIYDDPDNPWVAGGGAVRVLELYRRLLDDVQVTVATGNYPGATNTTRDGVKYQRLGSPAPYAWSRWSYARRASALLAEGDYDVAVFDHSVYTPLKIPANRPIGITVHHLIADTAVQRWGRLVGRLVALAERRSLRHARWLTATSLATYDQLRKVAPDATISQVGAGVSDEMFDLPHQEEDYLLYFGRLDWFQKGLDTLLDGFALLAAERPSLELRIAGRGKDLARVRARAGELNILPRLRLEGSVSDEERNRLFRGATLLLMPSRFEGFGMVAAEAMAAGVPVIAAAAGSLPEVVSPPDGGMLFPAGDATEMRTAAAALLDNAERRAIVSDSARKTARRFRWSSVARDHEEFLRTIHRDFTTTPTDQT